MPKKRCRPEEIIAKLREVEVLLGQGQKLPEVVIGESNAPPTPSGAGRSAGGDQRHADER